MTPREIRAHAERLHHLSGLPSPWPIVTTTDLREYALDIVLHCRDELTGAELRSVTELLDQLEPAIERARKDRRAKALAHSHAKRLALHDGNAVEALLDEIEALAAMRDQRQTVHEIRAAARRKQGVATRAKILRAYKVSSEPKRERAAHVAKQLRVTAQYVRRVLKAAGAK